MLATRMNKTKYDETTADLPTTQPINDEDDISMPFAPKLDNWAFLSSQQNYYENREIHQEVFRCGRALESDYILKNSKIPDEFLTKMSRSHFVIEKKEDPDDIQNGGIFAVLYDHSTCGTWINGHVVGKNRARPLVSGDMISLCFPENQAFRYVECVTSYLKL